VKHRVAIAAETTTFHLSTSGVNETALPFTCGLVVIAVTNPAAAVETLHQMHVDPRRFVDAQHPVLIEVGLLHLAVLIAISPLSAADRPNTMPLSICARMVSGLTW
jgi:hypothetical protein